MAANYELSSSCVPSEWKHVLQLYEKAINLKAEKKTKSSDRKSLLELDKWFQEELPVLIQSREEKHITYDEICKLMSWKLMRGKFRPSLTKLIQSNAADAVVKASKDAFQKLRTSDVGAAIKALSVLRGVGPATASAVLAAGAPESAAFMADESLKALPGAYPTDYSMKSYTSYNQRVLDCVQKLNNTDLDSKWNAHMVEKTLWTYIVIKELQPDLLDRLKGDGKRPVEQVSKEGAKPKRKKIR